MKKLALAATCVCLLASLFFQCKPNDSNWPGGQKNESAATTSATSTVLDTFADIQILKYEVPGWDELNLRQKTLIFYLSQAALAGRDIHFDQNCKWNLTVRRTLEAIYRSSKIDRKTADWAAFEAYSKRFWVSNGIHHHYNETKNLPAFSQKWLEEALKSCDQKNLPLGPREDATLLTAKLLPILFDPKILAKRTNKDEGTDNVATSAVNFYEGVTAAEVDAFYAKMKVAGDKMPPSYGLNSKLLKGSSGLFEQTYKVGGMYGAALEQVVFWLRKAQEVAETPKQSEAMGHLIEFYKTGDLRKFDAYNIAWVQDTASTVDFTNGFIETYHDPKGLRGDWQAYICYNDPEATKKMAIISKNAQWFEDRAPIPAEYRKASVKGISYRVINVAQEGGSCAPTTPIGENLPNAEWIREQYGSKSFSFNNIIEAYGKVGGASALAEFANDAEELERCKKYGPLTDKMHTALHEVLGHASGRVKPGVQDPPTTLKNYYATLEEARADLFALYYMPDPKLVELGVLPDGDAYKAEYDTYIRNGMMQQLRRLPLGANIEEDHMRNRQLVAKWAFEMGKKDNVIVQEKRDGNTFFDVKDYAKLRVLFGQLLSEIQRIKSEGDFEAGKNLVETFGVKVDPELHKEVKNRFAALPNKPFSGFVQPILTPVTDGTGRILDVKISWETDFTKQMLRFGKDWSFLPTMN